MSKPRRAPKRYAPRPDPKGDWLPPQALEPVNPVRLGLCWTAFSATMRAYRKEHPTAPPGSAHIHALTTLLSQETWTFPEVTRASAFIYAVFEYCQQNGDMTPPDGAVIERVIERASWQPLNEEGFFYDPLDLFTPIERTKATVQ